MTGPPAVGARLAELAGRLAAVEARIAGACTAAGRPRAEVTLVAVTKTWPAADALLLHGLGVRDLAENRAAEAQAKAAQVRAAGVDGARWHFVGSVQTNKAAVVAQVCDVVHAVDRPRLVTALDRGAEAAGRRLRVLLQVSLDGAAGRGGAAPSELPALADLVAGTAHLDLRGLMAVAPRDGDPDAAFDRLAALAGRLRAAHPAAGWVSAGMSGDLEAAVRHGATHLRVGSALLGVRPPVRR